MELDKKDFIYLKTTLESCKVDRSVLGEDGNIIGKYDVWIEVSEENEVIVNCKHIIEYNKNNSVMIDIEMSSVFGYQKETYELNKKDLEQNDKIKEYLTKPILSEISLLVGVLTSKMGPIPLIFPASLPEYN